jgi:glutaredoxin
MLCKHCKRAGEYLTAGKPDLAAIRHEACEHPSTCPCAHYTERSVLNLERINGSRTVS